VVQAHLDAAQRLGEQVEAQQVHLGVVVDPQLGEILHGLHQRLAAGLIRIPLDRGLVGVAFPALLRGDVGFRDAVRRVDLCLPAPRHVDPRVTGNGDTRRLPALFGNPQHDDRVGVDAGLVLGAQRLEQPGRERVALRVRPRIAADEQDVGPAIICGGDGSPGRVSASVVCTVLWRWSSVT
jgi:hypothetical protein